MNIFRCEAITVVAILSIEQKSSTRYITKHEVFASVVIA